MTQPAHYTWRKLASGKWEDAWVERLRWISDRLAITSLAGAKTIRLEAFELSRAQAERLKKGFGGVIALQKSQRAVSQTPRRPIRVRNRLVVAGSKEERDAAIKTLALRKVMAIPAGMAFGTGDHATTSACLRFLVDVSEEMGMATWDFLDLGCGSGILAIAARLLGAQSVLAGDFDPDAVRTAKQNVRLNRVTDVEVERLDVRTWKPHRTWDIVGANLYSGLLIEVAPVIAKACAHRGQLIFSGILRSQEAEVMEALGNVGFTMKEVVRKGKWVAGLAERA